MRYKNSSINHPGSLEEQAISLTNEQLNRYAQQLRLPGMTEAKQMKLLSSACLAVSGGEPLEFALPHLSSAGVGRVHVIGSMIAATNLTNGNPDVVIEPHEFQNDVPEQLFNGIGVVIESALDWQFKLRLSDMCMRMNVPLIHSGSDSLRFQLFTMVPGKSACLRCALPTIGIDDVPLEPVKRNTFPPIAACVGALMAVEAIKLLAGVGASQGNELWKVDGLSGEIEIVRGLDPRRDCPDCGRFSRP